ncbi:hypothetical protein BU23DRAFT_639424 [Bimuria novae-zelandiae CBS 107.79]|uniref:Uncharacterized protein n=1 Tax=Bimuria novae-zelandiae CBS 107.79 TaxID=1447943 RepID=A0A6A5VJW8_9PLEO|nr:hypothetical protein BU23DRAFT_639424 [Bimuria novae-zelandiae CBS 107.79]
MNINLGRWTHSCFRLSRCWGAIPNSVSLIVSSHTAVCRVGLCYVKVSCSFTCRVQELATRVHFCLRVRVHRQLHAQPYPQCS